MSQRSDGITVQCPEKLLPLLTKPKRIKVAVGGRGSAKSTTVADCWLRFCHLGERLCAARMYQNSIDESVHSMLQERSRVLGVPPGEIRATNTRIRSARGGEIFYKGLSRNIDSLLSMHGVKRFWVEEAASLSDEVLKKLLPTIRSSNSEIWFTLNRGRSTDPFSRRLLKPYERELKRGKGVYEDDHLLIVDINYWENPWFPPELEQQRQMDRMTLSPAEYEHVWHGAYADSVPGAIILPDWFDACVDAHLRLGIRPAGAEVVAFDPADSGGASKALAHRHGIVIKDVRYRRDGDVNEGGDWAAAYAIRHKVDSFVWDGDGLGLGLRRQFDQAMIGKKIEIRMFRGSQAPDFPNRIYEPMEQELVLANDKRRTIGDLVVNKRAQYYLYLRDRIQRTYLAVTKGVYTDPEQMISFSSEIEDLDVLRAEICSVPRKDNLSGKFQIMSKAEMKKMDIASPDGSDAVMMTLSGVDALRRKNAPMRIHEGSIIDSAVGY